MNKKIAYSILSAILIFASIYVIYNKYKKAKFQNQKTEVFNNIHNKIQEEWINKIIEFPDSLFQINAPDYSLEKYLINSKKEYALVSYLNADCSDCVVELKKWKDFLKNDFIKEKVKVFFVAYSLDKSMLDYQVNDQAKFNGTVFFDKNNSFKSLNSFPEMKAYQTFLLKEGKVKYVGSPIQGDLYKKEILTIIK